LQVLARIPSLSVRAASYSDDVERDEIAPFFVHARHAKYRRINAFFYYRILIILASTGPFAISRVRAGGLLD